jgi:hypothetical protein
MRSFAIRRMILKAGCADDSAGTSSHSLRPGILLSIVVETMIDFVTGSLSGDNL